MRRNWYLWAVVALIGLVTTGCCAAPKANQANSCNAVAAPAAANSCNPAALGAEDCSPIYPGTTCPPKPDLSSLPYPGSPACYPAPQPVAAPQCAAPQATTPVQCDPNTLPKDAKPGDVYCCVYVQPPAAPPCQVLSAPARTEWQRVSCPPGQNSSDDCWALVNIPAVYNTVYSAPPPGYWEWRLNTNCKAP
jgi:hypothetical protein